MIDIETLRAEVERLRDQCNRQEHGFGRRECDLQRQLAAANALLAEVLTTGLIPNDLSGRVDEHLNTQPATAPVPLAIDCPACGKEHVDTVDPVTGIDWATRSHKTHLCLHCGVLFKPYDHATVGIALTRTEAEQAVLDAWAEDERAYVAERIESGAAPRARRPGCKR